MIRRGPERAILPSFFWQHEMERRENRIVRMNAWDDFKDTQVQEIGTLPPDGRTEQYLGGPCA